MKATRFISSRIFSMEKGNLSSTVMKIAIISIALGISIMLISIAVVVGFKNQIRDKVVGFVSPIQIQVLNQNESIEETPFVYDTTLKSKLTTYFIEGAYPTANKAGLIKTDTEIHGIILKGVDKDYNWDYINSNLTSGNVPQYTDDERSNDVVISKIIADKLLLNIGDDVRLWFVGEDMKTRGRKFNIKGIYETGLTECDERFIYCDLNQIRRLNGWENDYVGHLEIQLKEDINVDEANNYIYYNIPTYLISYTARELYPHIFDWLDLQDMNVVIIIVLMLLVAGITIISMLLIIVLERTSTIGILKALGANNRFIRKVFLQRSRRILLIGMLIGNVFGIGLCLIQKYTEIITLSPESYYLSSVPIELNLTHVILLNAGTFLLWAMMMLIPTMVINNINPSKSIRFE